MMRGFLITTRGDGEAIERTQLNKKALGSTKLKNFGAPVLVIFT